MKSKQSRVSALNDLSWNHDFACHKRDGQFIIIKDSLHPSKLSQLLELPSKSFVRFFNSPMISHTQSLSCNLPPSILPTAHFPRRSVSIARPPIKIAFFKPLKACKFSIQPLKCSVSVVSDPPQVELSNNHKPIPAEVSRTVVELSSVGTLSVLTKDGSPIGFGVRFAVDLNGTPVMCLNEFDARSSNDKRCSLHVQVCVHIDCFVVPRYM